jgi:hypothetical protein
MLSTGADMGARFIARHAVACQPSRSADATRAASCPGLDPGIHKTPAKM